MIQDIGLQRYHCEYQRKEPKDSSLILCFYQNTILMAKNSDKMLPEFGELQEKQAISTSQVQYLFSIDETEYFLLNGEPKYEDSNYTYCNVREVRDFAALEICFAVSTGYQLFIWYRDNHFCGRCGKELRKGEKERMFYCPACGNVAYPKIAPAVIVGVIDGERILMTKYAGREYKKYSLVAGFCEIGETAEDTVKREVMEEVGLKVKNIRYYKSQPWGFDSNLLIGFFADLDGDDTIVREEEELAVAEWIERKNVVNMDDGISLTREMMDVFSRNELRN